MTPKVANQFLVSARCSPLFGRGSCGLSIPPLLSVVRRLALLSRLRLTLPLSRTALQLARRLHQAPTISDMAPIVVGLVGGGTVGGGVYDIVEYTHKEFFKSLGADIRIKKIAVRNLNKPRDFKVADHTELVGDWREVLEDKEINTVIEVMGGTTEAKEVVFGAIQRGKHVVTANKALLAAFLPELTALLAKHPEVTLGLEAAVCGGIPIIHTLQHDYLGDQISMVRGIMNGTTNFMLTKMEEGADYGHVLAEAQALGFAEADPTADVEGHDVQAKIALLAKLAFGTSVPLDKIPTKGISAITSVDFEYAKLLNSTIKLLGFAQLSPDGSKLSVGVSPFIVPKSHPIGTTNHSTNIVNITSRNLVSSSYIGPGAGRYPTANSVVNDVVRLARGLVGKPFPVERELPVDPDYTSRFYIRLRIRDQLGVIRVVGELAEKHGVSIHAILQNPIHDPSKIDFVVTTEPSLHSQITAFVAEVAKQDFTLAPPLFFGTL